MSSLREKEALHLLADSSYAPALYATLQDAKCIYFVQQYLSGKGCVLCRGLCHLHASMYVRTCSLFDVMGKRWVVVDRFQGRWCPVSDAPQLAAQGHVCFFFDQCQERLNVSVVVTGSVYSYPLLLFHPLFPSSSPPIPLTQHSTGGDLWSLLYGQRLSTTKCGGISPQNALFYFANILAAVDFMHSLGVVHRDLKPENILIDSNGYCKLTDFGTTVSISSTRTRSLVGCAEYICPEMIFYKLYGYSVDFWSLGVLLFELLTRSTPFFHANLSMLFQNVIDCEETMKTFFTNNLLFDAHVKQLITGLLVFNPNKRLGKPSPAILLGFPDPITIILALLRVLCVVHSINAAVLRSADYRIACPVPMIALSAHASDHRTHRVIAQWHCGHLAIRIHERSDQGHD